MARLNKNVLRTIAAVGVMGVGVGSAAPANALSVTALALPDPGAIISSWQRDTDTARKQAEKAGANLNAAAMQASTAWNKAVADMAAQAQRDINNFLAAQNARGVTVAQNIATTLNQLGGVVAQNGANQQLAFVGTANTVGAADTSNFISTLKANADDLGSLMVSVVKDGNGAKANAEITMILQKKDGSTVVNTMDNLPADKADDLAKELYAVADRVAASPDATRTNTSKDAVIAGLDQARLVGTAAQAAAVNNQPVLDAATKQMVAIENPAPTTKQMVSVTVNFTDGQPAVTTTVSNSGKTAITTTSTDAAGTAQNGLVDALADATDTQAGVGAVTGTANTQDQGALLKFIADVMDKYADSLALNNVSQAVRDAVAKIQRGETPNLSTFPVADLQALLEALRADFENVAPAPGTTAPSTTTPVTTTPAKPGETKPGTTVPGTTVQASKVVITVEIISDGKGGVTVKVDTNVESAPGAGTPSTGTPGTTTPVTETKGTKTPVTETTAASTETVKPTDTAAKGTETTGTETKGTQTSTATRDEPTSTRDAAEDARKSEELTSSVMAEAQKLNQSNPEPVATNQPAAAQQGSGSTQSAQQDAAYESTTAAPTTQVSQDAASAQEDLAVTGSDSNKVVKLLAGLGVLGLIAAAGVVWTVRRAREV